MKLPTFWANPLVHARYDSILDGPGSRQIFIRVYQSMHASRGCGKSVECSIAR